MSDRTTSTGTTTDRRADELPPVSALSYEQARDELVAIVARLESGQLGLEDSMSLWERGEALAAHCTRWLDGAQARLDGLTEPDVTEPDLTEPDGAEHGGAPAQSDDV